MYRTRSLSHPAPGGGRGNDPLIVTCLSLWLGLEAGDGLRVPGLRDLGDLAQAVDGVHGALDRDAGPGAGAAAQAETGICNKWDQ